MRRKLKTKIITLLLTVLIISCNESLKVKDKVPADEKIKVDAKFKIFFNNFQVLIPHTIFNTTCFDVSVRKEYKKLDVEKYKKLLNEYEGPAVSIGYLKDTSDCYPLIYCTAAACHFPNLAVYTKSGKLLETTPIASGCGSDMGYECDEKVEIINSNQIITVKNEKSYEFDSLLQVINSSVKINVSKIKYTVKNSKILIDTLQ
jgi:hypothetical protein